MKLIDLTHTISDDTPTWDGSCGFQLQTLSNYYENPTKVSFKVQSVTMNCGIGTHIDAPAHCFKDLPTIDKLSLEQLINPGVLIDISSRRSPHNSLSVNDILAFEDTYGRITKNTYVLVNTGWHRFWHQPTYYHNNYEFPYINISAAKLLLERDIKGVGIDTLSPDRPDSGYPVHHLLLANQVLIIENINNLDLLPPRNFIVTIAPLKIKDATESPARIWATF
jgi:kynurenine formamidase